MNYHWKKKIYHYRILSMNLINDYVQKINELKSKIENEIAKFNNLYDKVYSETKNFLN